MACTLHDRSLFLQARTGNLSTMSRRDKVFLVFHMPPFFLLRDDVSSELTRPSQLHSEAYVTSGYHIVTAQSIENLRIPMTYGPVSLLYLRDFRHLHSLNIARSRAV